MSTVHQAAHENFSVENYVLITVLDLQMGGYVRYLQSGQQRVTRPGNCSHCGAHLRYAAVLQHEPTGERIMVGETCLDNRFSGSQAEFEMLRKLAAAKAEASRRVGKLEVFLQANEDFRPLVEMNASDCFQLSRTFGEFVYDVIGKLDKYGELSPAQVAGVRKVVARVNEVKARRAAEAATLKAAPVGRVKVSGEVVSTKVTEGYYGTQFKMLVKSDENFKVWVTMPLGHGIEKGKRVTFTATLEQSKDDPTFAFGKRPRMAA